MHIISAIIAIKSMIESIHLEDNHVNVQGVQRKTIPWTALTTYVFPKSINNYHTSFIYIILSDSFNEFIWFSPPPLFISDLVPWWWTSSTLLKGFRCRSKSGADPKQLIAQNKSHSLFCPKELNKSISSFSRTSANDSHLFIQNFSSRFLTFRHFYFIIPQILLLGFSDTNVCAKNPLVGGNLQTTYS